MTLLYRACLTRACIAPMFVSSLTPMRLALLKLRATPVVRRPILLSALYALADANGAPQLVSKRCPMDRSATSVLSMAMIFSSVITPSCTSLTLEAVSGMTILT